MVGCSSGDAKKGGKNNEEPGSTNLVESVELDGFLLVMASDGLRLLDPESGKVSAESLGLSGEPNPSNHFSVSPNGRQIASVAKDGSLVIADITFENGTPGFEIVRQLEGDNYGRPRYTPDGLRILTTNVAVDPATGDTWPCIGPSARPSGNWYPLAPLPGGHRYVCPEAGQLKDDGDVLASDVAANAVTADGQFADVGVHVPSGSLRKLETFGSFDGAFALDTRAQLADGGFVSLYGSASGQGVAEEAANFVTVYKRVPIENEQRDGALFDIKEPFASGDWSKAKTAEWPMQRAGFPLLTEGDGRTTRPLGASEDEQFAFYASSAWRIDQDKYTNALHETVVESGFSVVDRDGNAKSFRTTSLGDVALLAGIDRDVEGAVLFQPELLQDRRLVDFGDGNMLAPVTGNGLASNGWGGYLDGKPYLVQQAGRMSRDGRWFFIAGTALSASNQPQCLMQVGSTAKKCISTSLGGTPVGIVGYGLKAAHRDDAPEILATSRSAAWPGSSVTVFGAHFGESGTLRIGDAAVADGDIEEWADDHVTFSVTSDSPKSGRLSVETEHGKGGTGRAFWFHRSRLVETPFDAIHVGRVELGQGLNVVNLGDYEADDAAGPADPNAVLSSRTRLESGEYVIYSPGSAEPVQSELSLSSGGFSHTVYFELQNRSADDTKWQLVQPSGIVDLAAQYPSFRKIAGDLIELGSGQHPVVSERVELRSFAPRIPSTVAAAYGSPDFFRERADDESALVLNEITATGRAFNEVLSWDADANGWGAPEFAATPKGNFIQFIRGVEAAGQVVVATGSDLLGTGKAGFQLSNDGGATFGAMTLVDAETGNAQSSLLEPIRVEAESGVFFLVLESLGVGDVLGVHAISTDGTFTPAVAEAPAEARLPAGLAPPKAPLDYVNVGGKLLLLFPVSHTLYGTDFDGGAETKAWTALPSAAAAGHVLNLWHDKKEARVFSVLDDGTVLSASDDAFDDPAAWEEVDLGIELALPTAVQPLAVSRLDDGRWFVLASTNDARKPAERSPFGNSAYLLGPKL